MLCRGLGRAGFLGGREEQVPEPLLRLSACPGPRIGDSYVGAGGECMASKKCERRDGAMSRHPPAVASSPHSCPKQRTQTRPTMVPSQCSEAEGGTTGFHEASGAREDHGREGRGVRVIRVSNQNVSSSSVEMPLLPSHPERIVCLAGLYRILGFTSNHPGTTTHPPPVRLPRSSKFLPHLPPAGQDPSNRFRLRLSIESTGSQLGRSLDAPSDVDPSRNRSQQVVSRGSGRNSGVPKGKDVKEDLHSCGCTVFPSTAPARLKLAHARSSDRVWPRERGVSRKAGNET